MLHLQGNLILNPMWKKSGRGGLFGQQTEPKRRSADIVKERAGPVGNAKLVKTELDSFLLFIDEEMLDLVVERTNVQISRNQPADDNSLCIH